MKKSLKMVKICFFSKASTATPRPVLHFLLRSEVSTKSQDTFESQSKTRGSLQEAAGTIRGERFNFGASNFHDPPVYEKIPKNDKTTFFFKKQYSNA